MKQTAIKQRPILFSTAMVKAILEGRKTMTRRIVKNNVPLGNWEETLKKCPYGVAGDILWVKETWAQWDTPKYAYKADFIQRYGAWERDTPNMFDQVERIEKWKPSIFMPKEACRLFLRVMDIRAERFNSISNKDAIAEGIQPLLMSRTQLSSSGQLYRDYCKKPELFNDGLKAIDSFCSLWESINGLKSLIDNPWVWVVSFERIDKPE